jgi:hypothetical protein
LGTRCEEVIPGGIQHHEKGISSLINVNKGATMNDEKYEEAKARVKELKDFYRNLLTYIAVNIL